MVLRAQLRVRLHFLILLLAVCRCACFAIFRPGLTITNRTGTRGNTAEPVGSGLLGTKADRRHLHGSKSSHRRSHRLRQKPYRMRLHNHADAQYAGDIVVGGQKLRGVIDSGSFELLVFSTECRLCGSGDILYNHSKSSFYSRGQLDVEHSFGSGETWSHEAADTVSVGDLTAERQPFWEVYDTEMPVLRKASFQAIVGVGPAGSARKLAQQRLHNVIRDGVNRTTLFDAQEVLAHASKKRDLASNLGANIFSICLGRISGAPGYFVWKDYDPRLRPDLFTRISEVGSVHWSVQLKNVRVGNGNYGDDGVVDVGCGHVGCGAVLDTGTSLLAAPSAAIKQVEAAFERFNGSCSRLSEFPDLKFDLGGQTFTLPPESYIGEVTGEIPAALQQVLHFKSISFDAQPLCQVLLMKVDAYTQFGPMWVLGMPFFRRYYTTFVDHSRKASQARKQQNGNEVFIAPASDDCQPSLKTSLLQIPRRRPSHLKIRASEIQIPSWASQRTRGNRVKL